MDNHFEIARIAEDNPDLPYSFIKNILDAAEERKSGLGVHFKLTENK